MSLPSSFIAVVRRAVVGLLAAPLALAAQPATAQGDLLVAPTRVIINGSGNAEVVLSNIGNQPATYRIGIELRRMQHDGDFADVSEAEANATERAALETHHLVAGTAAIDPPERAARPRIARRRVSRSHELSGRATSPDAGGCG